jgi:isopentenyl diphosphate isomerase/L-lactate dehydrogenase-like FMN-dependent dehydrogenase
MALRLVAERRTPSARNRACNSGPTNWRNRVGVGLHLAERSRTETGGGLAVRDPRAKLRHIEVCLTQPVEYGKPTGLEGFELTNQVLSDVSVGEEALQSFIEDVLTELRVCIFTAGAPNVRVLRGELEPVCVPEGRRWL